MGDEARREMIELARRLLAFGRAPGRYALALGEPRELFLELDTLAQWAQGRCPEDLVAELGEASAADLVGAAVLFIQRACFAPDGTHYQVLGFTPQSFAPELLRGRYRALIRLTHPDMGIAGLPADAAGMVNRAQDVLADAAARQRYDQQLQRHQAPPPAAESPADAWPQAMNPMPGRAGGRRPAAVAQLAESRRLGERWLSLTARYPWQWRAALLGVVIAVPLAGLLLWASQDLSDHGAIVVAKRAAPSLGPAAAPSPAIVPLPAPQAGQEARADARPAKVQVPHRPVEADPSAVRPAPPVPPASPPHAPRSQVALQAQDGHPADTHANPAPAPAARRDRPAVAQERPAADLPRIARAPSGQRQPATAAPAGAVVEPVAVWSVDAPAAKRYLGDIVATMESAPRARHLQAYLAGMHVEGSLLRPVVDLLGRYPELRVQRSAWSEDLRPGALRVRSVVVLQPRASPEPTHTYRLLAEFRGTESGTVLVRLDFGPE